MDDDLHKIDIKKKIITDRNLFFLCRNILLYYFKIIGIIFNV